MARYTGPRRRIIRALGTELPGLSRKPMGQRTRPPGEAARRRKRRRSEAAAELTEKQKLRYNYGVSERQMLRMLAMARRSKGNTGKKLLELLERRLDNAVFRTGFAPTLAAARQLVTHRHVRVNDRTVDRPSAMIDLGDVISLKERALHIDPVVDALTHPPLERPEWIHFDEATKRGRITRLPTAGEVPFPIEVQRVIAYYADRP